MFSIKKPFMPFSATQGCHAFTEGATGCPKCKRTNDFPITPEILVRVNFQKYPLEDHYLTFFVSKSQRSSSKGLEMAAG